MSLTIVVHWGPRRQTAAEGADPLSHLLCAYADVSRMLDGWFKRVSRPNPPPYHEREPIAFRSPPDLARLIAATRKAGDPCYVFGAWNGLVQAAASFRVSFGYASPHFPNSFSLTLPEAVDAETARLLEPEMLRSLFQRAIEVCDPNWVFIVDRRLEDFMCMVDRRMVGWLTYVANELLGRMKPGGQIIAAGPDLPAVTYAGLMQTAERLKQRISTAGD